MTKNIAIIYIKILETKRFKETKFIEWSKKAQKLRDRYSDEQIEDFRIELKKLSDKYYVV